MVIKKYSTSNLELIGKDSPEWVNESETKDKPLEKDDQDSSEEKESNGD